MAPFVMNRCKLKILSLLQTIIGTWATQTKESEWLIAIQLVREHEHAKQLYHSIILW
jgi:hypothetical protein